MPKILTQIIFFIIITPLLSANQNNFYLYFETLIQLQNHEQNALKNPGLVQNLYINRYINYDVFECANGATVYKKDEYDLSFIETFKNLRKICFSESGMNTLYLDDLQNDIQVYSLFSIPPMPNLDELSIYDAGLVKSSLKYSEAAKLLKWVSQFPNLKILNLSRNNHLLHNTLSKDTYKRNFSDIEIKYHDFSILSGLKNLEEIIIKNSSSYNIYTKGQLNGIDKLQQLKKVDFSYNPWDWDGESLSLLFKLNNLEELNISYSFIYNRDSLRKYNELDYLSYLGMSVSRQELDYSNYFWISLNDKGRNIDNIKYALNYAQNKVVQREHYRNFNIDYTWDMVSRFKPLNSLKKLQMDGTPLNTLDFAHLFPNLEWLDIKKCYLVKLDMRHLKDFTNLKHLGLGSTKMPRKQAQQLKAIAPLMNLEELDLGESGIQYPGWQEIEVKCLNVRDLDICSLAPNLKTLNLFATNVNENDIASILPLKALENLSLGHTDLQGVELNQLAKLPSLKVLNLFRCNLEGIDFSKFHHLEYLDLDSSTISQESWETLRTLKSLKTLDISEIHITNETIKCMTISELAKALPECHIINEIDGD